MKLKVSEILYKYNIGSIKIEDYCSGKKLCEDYLIPMYKEAVHNDDVLEIDMSNFQTSIPNFLEEAFGGMVRSLKVDYRTIFHNMIILNCEDPKVNYLILTYMHNTSKLI